MSACTQQGCDGRVAADGYCDTCGLAAAPAHSGAARHAVSAAPPAMGGACQEPGCGGTVAADGYCDTCGLAAAASSRVASGSTPSQTSPSIAVPVAPGTSGRVDPTSRRTSSQRTGSTRTRLGAGLLTIAPTEVGDPALAVMSAEKIAAVIGAVPEDRRVCSKCGQEVGRMVDGRPGRITGFCSNCRTPFDFQTNAPKLAAADLVAGQYEILGPLAHGGMGWIYLGRDQAVSDRWVVLKGLLNENDPDAAASAVAERRFLAQIEHANIVNIYNFVTHLGRGYIVMEFVGGQSLNGKLKDRRKANNGIPDPLPASEAIAYIHGVLPAFGYLHDLGLVYNDLKPANVMAVGDDVKLIDVGAVMRAADQDAAIFGTAGFQAPEVAATGPSISSDLFTVGRTLAVLLLDFVFHAGPYLYEIPPPREHGVLARWESLYRFLLKATAAHPDDRFQDSGAMAEQLTGVLREIVAVTDAAPRPAPSRLFSGDRVASQLTRGTGAGVTEADWRTLPEPKVDPGDAAAAFLQDLDEVEPHAALSFIANARDDAAIGTSRELLLAYARALIESGGDPEQPLAELVALDPWEWRVEWYRAVHHLRQGEAAAAAEGFSRVWTELPGEMAPRLGAAMAAEAAGEYQRAAPLYERVVSVDTTYVSAAFGLARCRIAGGDRAGAVAAFQLVPPSSATYQAAQVAAARTLIGHAQQPDAAELAHAAQTVERLQLDAAERARLSAEILERALAGQESGSVAAAEGATLFGRALDERNIRVGLESAYRELARLSANPSEKVRLVDRANAVRPRTLV